MGYNTISGSGVDIKLWTNPDGVEPQALAQLKNIASLPWVFKHVAVMPDVHYGKGATVGSVVAMKNAVSPAAVGVDIGCGMGAIRTNLTASDLPDSLAGLRVTIEATIPVGFNSHPEYQAEALNHSLYLMDDKFDNLHKSVQGLRQKALNQLGTLGGGNHFIELCLDTEDRVWMMLHSGSRNIGKTLAEIHINVAKKLIHNVELPDPDLAVFLSGTEEMRNYLYDLKWAQNYAFANRRTMFELYKKVMLSFFKNVTFDVPILCHHNYVSEESHFGENLIVTRKGAISAKLGQLGIIPGSMGAKSFIVEGLANADSFTSASHGAGRLLSRGAAKRKFTVADLEEQTKGVECRKDVDVLDEIPAAYKDIDQVMRDQSDLVEIRHELRQVLCVKG